MRVSKYHIIIVLMMLLPFSIKAQIKKGLTYSVEAGATMSSGSNAPFWLVANKHGLSSISDNNAYLSAGIFRDIDRHKRFSYAFGLELAALGRFTSTYVVQQAYADVRYRFLELSVGSKERGSELKNDMLSTGGLSFSTNARPIPQFRISIAEYIPFPGTKHWIHIKAHIAYGKFTDDKFQIDFTQKLSTYNKDALYHSKSGYIKVEHETFPLTFEFGMEMATQFGGDTFFSNGQVFSNPKKIGDFIRVLIPMRGGGGSSKSDQINISGNHLGSYNISAEYRFSTWKVRGYYEHFFEDGSGMMMKYGMWRDCLAGLEVTLPRNPIVSSVVGEFLYTKHQSGVFHTDGSTNDRYTGGDNYYNNGSYVGWEHWGQGIGNPLLVSPIYNTNNRLSFLSNRVRGFHIGVSGNPTVEIGYRVLVSCAKHWGTYGSPFPEIKTNNNVLVEVSYSPKWLNGWHCTVAGAADGGNMLGRSIGGMLTICKTGLIGRMKK